MPRMGSDVNTQIFFKDKKNDLKGPFTERQVQEWYRQKWFENSFLFYFMKDNERPNDDTAFHTLEDLKSLNGIGCPFKTIESSGENRKEKLTRLEKELADLSRKCEEVKKLEKRVEQVEKRLKDLSTQKPAPNVAPAAAKKTDHQDAHHTELANQWTAYYLDVLEAFKTGKKDKVGGKRAQQFDELSNVILESELAHKKCREMLLTKLKALDYFYCATCDAIFQTYKQILLHALELTHCDEDQSELPTVDIHAHLLSIVEPMLKDLLDAENKIEEEEKSKYGSLDSSAAHLRPQLGFVDQFTHTYGDAICDYRGGIGLNRAQIVSKMMPRLKQLDHMGRKMMSELHEHIGDKQTRCYECNKVTGTRDEYYRHLRSHIHLTKGNAMDLITLVVNKYKKE